jgi:hypothetical protein
VNENGRTQDEDYLLEINEKIPVLEMEADIALLDNDYIIVDKFYNLVFEEKEADWVFELGMVLWIKINGMSKHKGHRQILRFR